MKKFHFLNQQQWCEISFYFYFDVLYARSPYHCSWFICDNFGLRTERIPTYTSYSDSIQRAQLMHINSKHHYHHTSSYVCTNWRKIEYNFVEFRIVWLWLSICYKCSFGFGVIYSSTNTHTVWAIRFSVGFSYCTLWSCCSRPKTRRSARAKHTVCVCVHSNSISDSICLAPTNTIAAV